MTQNRIKMAAPPKPNFIGEDQFCTHCDGCGLVSNHVCKACNGHGVVRANDYGASVYAPTPEQLMAMKTLGGVA